MAKVKASLLLALLLIPTIASAQNMTLTTQYCIDNTTLVHVVNITQCYQALNQCYNYTIRINETCQYGCANDVCLPPKYWIFGGAIILLFLISSLIYIAWRVGK